MIFNILWEMVVSSHINMKISAASLLKVIVSFSPFYLFSFLGVTDSRNKFILTRFV